MAFHIGIFLSLILLNSICSHAAVSSVDLGSESLKVAVVNLKPGQPPISIAINEMSKRKTPSLVSFLSGERLIGEEASGLLARYPDKVFSHLRELIGKPYHHVIKYLDSLHLHYDVFPEESRNVAAFRTENGNFTAEELVAMLLKYAVGLAETHVRVGTVKDAVITVPPYMGVAERNGLLTAAQLAGVNVLALVNEHSGAALQYGIDKDFSNGSRHVIFYDMGAGSTYAALVYFSAYNSKEFGRTASVNQFQVKDVRWDAELGGEHFELRLVEHFADEFNRELGNGIDVRKSPKAMAKLKKQVKRTKEILSANTAAPISVESLYDDRDFRSTITREKFEELCEDLWEKAIVPLKEVLKNSGLKIEEIYAVELIGGGTRVPKLQAKLQEFLGRKELDKHLDADEAVVLGASLHAANLSDGIKLNRKLGMIDGSTYGFTINIDGLDLPKDESTNQFLIPRMKKLPSKLFRSIIHDKDFEVSLAYESKDLLPPGTTSLIFAQYAVGGLADAKEKYAARNISAPIKTNLHFSLSRSGTFSMDRADSVIEISEWVEVPRKNLTVEDSTSTSANNTSEGSDGKLDEEGVSSDSFNTTASNASSPTDLVAEKKLKKRTFRVPLKITEKIVGPGMSLSEKSLGEAKFKLEELDRKDAERRRTAELKNNLEGYIYNTREKIESEEFEKIATEQERKLYIERLDEVQEWLYTDGEDALATEFEKHLDTLKAIGDPIFHRYNELTARPAASGHARQYLTELQQIVHRWESDKSWLPRARIDEVLEEAEQLKNWLNKKEAEQDKTPRHGTPAFTSEEVYNKLFALQDKVAKVNKIPKPKPKVEKPVTSETESSKEKENANSPPEESSLKEETVESERTDGDDKTSTEPNTNSQQPESHDEL
ncbi:unnamed protein product [Cuscuta epithymum]|uniref:Heat shock 70 kDa protein 17 n=1 Tax=Cuscuta epithymum TaxID=186058 RepID=A0AAV0EGY1_9ASTE|nr:unnamed protein product [Cuscuta epithymum]CAH9123092.1 unnamed protein product [Cuscuta epithymum]